ncbi:MAG: hypothetical protein PF569_03775 [Candidatus Woesearchaeota archaeon]|jgi:hypothetical protein|nr:hypothetical protein [Candidatus Woesearchaeota archaeon]
MILNDKHRDGDIKVLNRFALFPVRVSENRRLWLEKYKVVLKYTIYSSSTRCWNFVKYTYRDK